jgi:hypothetical protein
MTAPLEDTTEAGGMPGETYEIHRASALMTLAVSVIVTAVLVLAATDPRETGADPGQPGPAPPALTR